MNYKKIVGHALGLRCRVWSLNKGDRYVKAYFPTLQHAKIFEDRINNLGLFLAYPPHKTFYSVGGCNHCVITYF